eukprot:scaffold73697_cov60-Cyclotella_meneghiniana.AAC.1
MVEQTDCKRTESYVCSNPFCDLRMCKRCYDAISLDHMTTVIPHNGEDIEDDSVDNNSRSSVELEPIEEEPLAEDPDDESSDGSFVQPRDVMAEVMQDFVVTTEQDPTLNITVDNRPTDVGFHSTDA